MRLGTTNADSSRTDLGQSIKSATGNKFPGKFVSYFNLTDGTLPRRQRVGVRRVEHAQFDPSTPCQESRVSVPATCIVWPQR